ncbi:LacI family DNA-binding transcriptional regulator [Cerasicoccus arenae]|uniref:HTH lacI-type domain-containing protein n=1 Tax=Cerasicoccus arenae TaxID=424488 RepID=A0A8J3DAV1_9BACT|nr:LacI family DNA-binding transcriptional regulator [Cerasicoccus arenae]MBK1859607.1 LacI family DNA-binding transcriptional regulator [Cerasicoccus arenae]GHC03620.1 hypothetical protein GCM10007047_20290 [Cerasicoccus arenae]
MALKGYVRQKDIAREAGVHVTTVSMALKDDQRLAESTRKRIRAIAEKMGYRPDPMLSAITVHRNQSKRSHHQGTLAWINPVSSENTDKIAFPEYFRGAKDRCEELGYKLEPLYFPDLGGQRLHGVLKARNIRGLLIPPQTHSRFHLEFDWSDFSSVCFGFTLSWPLLHLVTNAQYHSTRLSMRLLLSRGYRRLGFITSRETDERTDQNFLAGFLAEQQNLSREQCLPPHILEETTINEEPKRIRQWFDKHKPDAIIYHFDTLPVFLEKAGISEDACGLASLSLTDRDKGVAGIFQNDFLIGRKAVDVVVDMLHRNERGIPEHRFHFLVESDWVEGRTIRNPYS